MSNKTTKSNAADAETVRGLLPEIHDMREESLEQVAAHCGYRPWREFCEMTVERDALKAKLAALVAVVELLRVSENTELRPEYDRAFADDDLLREVFTVASAAKEVL